MAAIVAAFACAGFWWLEGLAATVERYRVGIAVQRRRVLPRRQRRCSGGGGGSGRVGRPGPSAPNRRFLLCGVASAVLVAINASGFSEGEVERISLPFVPWVATGVIGLHESAAVRRRWRTVQAAAAVTLQFALLSVATRVGRPEVKGRSSGDRRFDLWALRRKALTHVPVRELRAHPIRTCRSSAVCLSFQQVA